MRRATTEYLSLLPSCAASRPSHTRLTADREINWDTLDATGGAGHSPSAGSWSRGSSTTSRAAYSITFRPRRSAVSRARSKKTCWTSAVGPSDDQLVVLESAVDALSSHQIQPEAGARYLSTAGSVGTRQIEIIRQVIGIPAAGRPRRARDRQRRRRREARAANRWRVRGPSHTPGGPPFGRTGTSICATWSGPESHLRVHAKSTGDAGGPIKGRPNYGHPAWRGGRSSPYRVWPSRPDWQDASRSGGPRRGNARRGVCRPTRPTCRHLRLPDRPVATPCHGGGYSRPVDLLCAAAGAGAVRKARVALRHLVRPCGAQNLGRLSDTFWLRLAGVLSNKGRGVLPVLNDLLTREVDAE
jgi:hypothetical protein